MQLDPSRLAVLRRIYVYTVALISLLAGLVAFNNLTLGLLGIWVPAASAGAPEAIATVGRFAVAREAIARSAGLLVVATPLFLLHWWYANHRLAEPVERRSAWRKLFLYSALAAGIIAAFSSLSQLLYDLLFHLLTQLAWGGFVNRGADPAAWLQNALFGLCGAGLIWYWQHILADDGDYGREQESAAQVRRIFLLLVGLTGGVLVILGGAALVEVALGWPATRQVVQAGSVAAGRLASGVALLTVGMMLLQAVTVGWGRLTTDHLQEGRSALRRLYLFAGLLGSAIAVLTPATLILRELLLMLFGSGTGQPLDLYLDLIVPLSYVPPGLWLYWRFRRTLDAETARSGHSPESVTVQRIAHYLTVAVGLILSWIGLVEVLQALIEQLSAGAVTAVAGRLWIEPLATGLSLLAVGLPIWLFRWRTIQAAARSTGETGDDERTSGPRRIYLYGSALISALFVLFSVAQILYRLFLLLMGEPAAVLWSSETANEVARGGVALLIWIYHIQVIRRDNSLTRASEPAGHAGAAHAARQSIPRLEARILLLEADLAAAREELAQARLAAEAHQSEEPASDPG